jgi:hypothetical protein
MFFRNSESSESDANFFERRFNGACSQFEGDAGRLPLSQGGNTNAADYGIEFGCLSDFRKGVSQMR